jgi:glycerophosphoryl diester phosphodiesterase
MKRPLVIAHRGASAAAPENTPAALEAAVAAGADLVEVDVRLSADGVPVCAHDPDLRRIAGLDLRIADGKAADLKRHGVASLADMIAAASGRMPLLIDPKGDGADYWRIVLGALPKVPNTVIGVRSVEAASTVRRAWPSVAILGFVPAPGAAASFIPAGATLIRLWEPDAAEAAGVRALGAPVWIMTGRPHDGSVGEATADSLSRLFALSPDGVLVNDPALAIATYGKAGTPT